MTFSYLCTILFEHDKAECKDDVFCFVKQYFYCEVNCFFADLCSLLRPEEDANHWKEILFHI